MFVAGGQAEKCQVSVCGRDGHCCAASQQRFTVCNPAQTSLIVFTEIVPQFLSVAEGAAPLTWTGLQFLDSGRCSSLRRCARSECLLGKPPRSTKNSSVAKSASLHCTGYFTDPIRSVTPVLLIICGMCQHTSSVCEYFDNAKFMPNMLLCRVETTTFWSFCF